MTNEPSETPAPTPLPTPTPEPTPTPTGDPASAPASSEPAAPAVPAAHVNSVDATAGQPMFQRVTERKHELEALLEGLAKDDTDTRRYIEEALASVDQLLTGDPANVPAMVGIDMNRWLERHKHLGERNDAAPPTAS